MNPATIFTGPSPASVLEQAFEELREYDAILRKIQDRDEALELVDPQDLSELDRRTWW